MTKKDKLNFLKRNYPIEWSVLRNRTFDMLSDAQTFWCCCGKLATGLHEKGCVKFNEKVDSETLKQWEEKHGKIKTLAL